MFDTNDFYVDMTGEKLEVTNLSRKTHSRKSRPIKTPPRGKEKQHNGIYNPRFF